MRIMRLEMGVTTLVCVLGLAAWLVSPVKVTAHCDTLDGPVVMDAKSALEKGGVTPVLKWVKREHDSEIRAAFEKALVVRSKGSEAKDLADTYFFETIVRLHREGEGAPYSGLQPAGETDPSVAAADKALADGNVDELARKIGQAAEKSVRERFERLILAKKHKDESVEAGREYVDAYVIFVHHVEGLHNMVTGEVSHH